MKLVEENGLRKLVSEAGMVLTNGEAYKEGTVYLGCIDKSSNWHEITVAEYLDVQKSMEDQLDL